jgi:hypothetical protein
VVKIIAALLLSLSVACSAGGPGADGAPVFAAEQTAPATAPAPCERVYSPDVDSARFVEAAAARWSAATGCEIRVGAGRIPVTMSEQLTNPITGEHPQGITEYLPTRIGLQRGMVPTVHQAGAGVTDNESMLFLVAMHEMGHSLGIHQEMDLSGGVMSVSGDGLVHAAELEVVCAAIACEVFAPEAQ